MVHAESSIDIDGIPMSIRYTEGDLQYIYKQQVIYHRPVSVLFNTTIFYTGSGHIAGYNYHQSALDGQFLGVSNTYLADFAGYNLDGDKTYTKWVDRASQCLPGVEFDRLLKNLREHIQTLDNTDNENTTHLLKIKKLLGDNNFIPRDAKVLISYLAESDNSEIYLYLLKTEPNVSPVFYASSGLYSYSLIETRPDTENLRLPQETFVSNCDKATASILSYARDFMTDNHIIRKCFHKDDDKGYSPSGVLMTLLISNFCITHHFFIKSPKIYQQMIACVMQDLSDKVKVPFTSPNRKGFASLPFNEQFPYKIQCDEVNGTRASLILDGLCNSFYMSTSSFISSVRGKSGVPGVKTVCVPSDVPNTFNAMISLFLDYTFYNEYLSPAEALIINMV